MASTLPRLLCARDGGADGDLEHADAQSDHAEVAAPGVARDSAVAVVVAHDPDALHELVVIGRRRCAAARTRAAGAWRDLSSPTEKTFVVAA